MWINPCAQVIFDSDPAPKDISGPAGVEMMSQAMIRSLRRSSHRAHPWTRQRPRCVKTHIDLFFLFMTGVWWMKKEISLWPTSCQTKTHFASARETAMREWITCQKKCNWELLMSCYVSNALCKKAMLTNCVCLIEGTTTRLPGSTTGTWRTKPARVTRRTTSSSSETEMVFTTMSLRRG